MKALLVAEIVKIAASAASDRNERVFLNKVLPPIFCRSNFYESGARESSQSHYGMVCTELHEVDTVLYPIPNTQYPIPIS